MCGSAPGSGIEVVGCHSLGRKTDECRFGTAGPLGVGRADQERRTWPRAAFEATCTFSLPVQSAEDLHLVEHCPQL